MIVCNVDESGGVLTMSYGQQVDAEEMKRCLGTVRDLMEHLKSDFLLLTDLSNLESMDAACAPDLGAIMDLCSARGMSSEVRVIPDPGKDIGFVLISRFHHNPPVKTQTYQSLAEAIKSFRAEVVPTVEPEQNVPDLATTRKNEGDQAEAHFTVTAREDAEVNEGGFVGSEASTENH